ncbi:MAG: polysaccharide pyruvyl transferase family protein [Methyloprofundus sp.]|nr:polysaccharide pyruvyl transferase family protein [Methyloprofundus sp.]
MKIALITIQNANNYGAVLQTFAMQEILKKYGEVDVLNYENRHISRSFDLIRLKPNFHGLLGAGKDLCRLFPRYRAINKFKKFISQKINLTENLNYGDLVAGKANGYDIYVAGSDQIWNPVCVSDKGQIDLGYFLNFVPKEAKKISYASSMGGHLYTAEESQIVKRLLADFDHLAVREKNTQTNLMKLLGRPVEHVLDPTLLLNKQAWLKSLDIEEKKDKQEKYILLYTVPKMPLIKQAVDFYSKKLGIKVISLEQGLSAGAKVNRQVRDAGPKEFIELFASAEFIITDSFHGTCFALNLEKPFVAVSPDKHANRIESLLGLVGLEQRIVRFESDLNHLETNVNLSDAIHRLESIRANSIAYINTSFASLNIV